MTQKKKKEVLDEMKAIVRRFDVLIQLLEENPEEVYTEEEPVVKISDTELETMVTEHIKVLGVPAHIKGYTYAKEAILQGLKDKDSFSSITKILYPDIARKNQTTPSRVERDIRHAIETAWTHGNIHVQEKIFGYNISAQKGKPTNSEFLHTIVDYITLQVQKEGKRIS